MLDTQETLTGHLTGTGSISGSVGSKSAVNAVVNNGVVVPDEIDPTVPSYVKEITEEELNSKGYLTEHQDLSEYATIEALNQKAEATHTHSQYLTEVPSEYVTERELNNKGYATKQELENLDVDLSDYYTKSEIDNKGYLTQEDIGDIDVDINSISDETIKDIVNIQITNANEVSY